MKKNSKQQTKQQQTKQQQTKQQQTKSQQTRREPHRLVKAPRHAAAPAAEEEPRAGAERHQRLPAQPPKPKENTVVES